MFSKLVFKAENLYCLWGKMQLQWNIWVKTHWCCSSLSDRHVAFYCVKCCGFKSYKEQQFIDHTNESGYSFMYVCIVLRDTGYIFIMREILKQKKKQHASSYYAKYYRFDTHTGQHFRVILYLHFVPFC